MAREIFFKNVENNEGYDIRCRCFKRIKGTQTYEPKVYCVFYAKEISPFQATTISINGRIKDTRYQATIETLDVVNNLENDDKIMYKNEMYRIDSIGSISITSQAYSIRPTKKTTIVLVR